jgi:hypothetical protein
VKAAICRRIPELLVFWILTAGSGSGCEEYERYELCGLSHATGRASSS